MNFREHIRKLATHKSRLLEIGPSYNPIIPKSMGYPVTVMDHAPQAELVAKYATYGVDTSKIEAVDLIATSVKSLPSDQTDFDLIIASHLIEHTTDFIDFINSCAERLSSNGCLILIIPDKRFCFDFFRPLTSPGSVINASFYKHANHVGGLFDHYAYFCNSSGHTAWNSVPRLARLRLTHTSKDTMQAFSKAQETAEYTDAHEWVFTPNSFRHLISELRDSNFIKLGIHELYSHEFEFMATLSKVAAPEAFSKIELLRLIHQDLRIRDSHVFSAIKAKINRLLRRFSR